MENKTKKKRFYQKFEVVWSISNKARGVVQSIDLENMNMTVKLDGKSELLVDKMWNFDKIKYSAKATLEKEKKLEADKDYEKLMNMFSDLHQMMYPEVFFAKIREDAIIPSKRDEDAGYDIYANFEGTDLYCRAGETTFVPTGIASAMPPTHYLNAKHERGSTAKISMAVLAGVVDSGFRNEIFIAITPLNDSRGIVISKHVTEITVMDNHIFYPYSKAIAQATIDIVPKAKITVITYDELQKIDSERGMTMLGQSGK